MYCSCPYASDGNNYKHMAAVLYAWSESTDNNSIKRDTADILFRPAYTVQSRTVKRTTVENLVAQGDAFYVFFVSFYEKEQVYFKVYTKSIKKLSIIYETCKLNIR